MIRKMMKEGDRDREQGIGDKGEKREWDRGVSCIYCWYRLK